MNTKERTLYTAVGRFRTQANGDGEKYPVVLVNQRECLLDPQEMTVWTILNWRLLDLRQLEEHYDPFVRELRLTELRTLESCLARLETRGLIAAGRGENDFDALYDLLAGLYVVPISRNTPLRMITFLKMLLLDGVPFSKAKALFQNPPLGEGEEQIMSLARQALLSTAELIRCMELGVTDLSSADKLMDALYRDAHTTSDNLIDQMRSAMYRGPVVMNVASLCLHKQIIFERV